MMTNLTQHDFFFFWWCKYVLGQLEDTGAAESIGTAVGLGLGVQAGRLLLVDIGQEVELFEGK